jgi:hypothetical protein
MVAEENRCLRMLLGQFGMTDDAISAWVKSRVAAGKKSKDDSSCSNSKSGNRCKAGSYKVVEASSDRCQSQALQRRCNNPPRYLPTDEMVMMEEIRQEEDDDDDDDDDDYSANTDAADPSPKASKTDNSNSQLGNSTEDQARTVIHSTALLENLSEISQWGTPPPCKLLSHLTTDDTAQAIAPSDDEMDSMSTEDGVPCSTAYKLLRRHATSDDKIDALARVLEGGCAPDSKGGCKVKHKIVAEALVDMCL